MVVLTARQRASSSSGRIRRRCRKGRGTYVTNVPRVGTVEFTYLPGLTELTGLPYSVPMRQMRKTKQTSKRPEAELTELSAYPASDTSDAQGLLDAITEILEG